MGIADTWDDISEDELNESKFKDRESDEFPDGQYIYRVVKFDYFCGRDGREYHKFGLVVDEGIQAGKYTVDFGSDNRVGIKILKEKLYLLTGRIPEVDEVFDVENNCAGPIKTEVLGKSIRGKKITTTKSGKVYINVYFNGLANRYLGSEEDGRPPHTDADAPSNDDENIPV